MELFHKIPRVSEQIADDTFEYTIFNQIIEENKFKEKVINPTPYIIKNDEYLPILKGNFNICDSQFNQYQLFFDINLIQQ